MDFKLNKSNLNFRVYTASALPSTAQKNDICVISDVPMKNWILSPDAPSGAPRTDGDVWIQYSVTGNTVNVVKTGAMMVATIAAWQYIDGAWVSKTAKSYRGDAWVDWIVHLFNDGEQCINVTGGWTTEGYTGSGVSVSAGEILADGSIGLYGADNVHDMLGTKNPIDLSEYSAIIADGAVISSYSNGISITISVCSQKQNFNKNIVATAEWNSASGVVTIDVSKLTGKYYIVVYAGSRSGCKGTVREIGLK